MSTELEDAVADALRSRAGEVPHTSMPRLGVATTRAPRRWLVPVAAAVVAAAAIAGAVVVLQPGEQVSPPVEAAVPRPDPDTLAPGEVYYQREVRSDPDGGRFIETELWQSPQRTGPWRMTGFMGSSVENGRVVRSGGEQPGPESGRCYPAISKDEAACTNPATWAEPTPDFLAAAPHDPAELGRQLHAAAVADAQQLVDDGDLDPGTALSEPDLALRQLAYAQETLSANGVPVGLRAALHAVVAKLPGIELTEGMADRLGRRGTGYSLAYPDGGRESLVFDGDIYLGTPLEAVVHGVAPGIGKAPSRMLG